MYPNDPVFVVRQKVTLAQAIQCYTYNDAYQMRIEDQVGSIAVGKKADLVFLEKNLFKISPETIHSTIGGADHDGREGHAFAVVVPICRPLGG